MTKQNNFTIIKKRRIIKKGKKDDEKDISTQKETEKQGTRFQKENAHQERQKRSEKKKKQGAA